MNLPTLKKQILEKDCGRFFVFHGVEGYVIETYIKKIAEVHGLTPVYPNSLASVYKKLPISSLFDGGKLYVVTNDKEAYRYEETYKDLPEIIRKSGNGLILRYDQLTPAAKIAQVLEDYLVEFTTMGDEVVAGHIERMVGETPFAAILAKACDNDYGRVLMELDKVTTLAEVMGKTPQDVFRQAFEDGVIVPTSEGDVFEYLEAIAEGDFDRALAALDCVRRGVTTQEGFVAMLYPAVRDMLLVRAARTLRSKNVEDTTGLSQFQVRAAGKRISGMTTGRLVTVMETLHQIESLMKGGLSDESLLTFTGTLLMEARQDG